MWTAAQHSLSLPQVMDGGEASVDDGPGDLVPLPLLLSLNPAALKQVPPQLLCSRNGRIK